MSEETEWTDMEPIDTTKPVVFRRPADKDLFRGCVVTLCGKLKPDQVALRRVIQAYGGQTVQGAGDNVTHALASKKEVRKGALTLSSAMICVLIRRVILKHDAVYSVNLLFCLH